MKYSYRSAILLLSLATIVAVLYYLYRYAMDSPYRISSEKAKMLLREKKIDLILDVRTDAERSLLGYYHGSVHMQSSDLEKRMEVDYPDKSIRILAYCNSGQRARAAIDKLHALGYTNAVYIVGMHTTLN
jgi:rhodanese-related sulfurtransferase